MTSFSGRYRAPVFPRGLVIVGCSLLAFAVGVGVGPALRGRSARRPAAEGRLAEELDDAATSRAAGRNSRGAEQVISPPRRSPNDVVADEGAHRHSQTQSEARRLVDGVTRELLLKAKPREALGIESVGSAMAPYLRGMMTGLLATNPELVREMGEALAEQTCSHPQSDVELMIVSHMVFAAPQQLGKPRTFECALQGRKKEDVLLWTMIDAWRASGQPMPSAIAEMQEVATDDRTKRRLSNYEQSRNERLAALNNEPPANLQGER